MAYTKKNITNSETIKKEEIVETVENNKETIVKEKKETIVKVDKELDDLKEQLKEQAKMIEKLTQALAFKENTTNKRFDEIKIIHLEEMAQDLTTHIELSNLTIDFTRFGEERTLTLQQCEELIGKYRGFFDRGILAIGNGFEDFAKRQLLKTAKEYPLTSEFIRHLDVISSQELEDIYNKLGEGHKEFIISRWMQKIVEEIPSYCDSRKIEILNRLTNGKMSQVLREMTEKKIQKK